MNDDMLIDVNNNFPEISPEKLAFIGDAVYELLVRNEIVRKYNYPIGNLNNIKVQKVCCTAQSDLYDKIKDYLSEEELIIYKRGRNAHIGTVPKKVSALAYHRATGIEVLFGFLYLSGKEERLRELVKFLEV